MARGLESRGRGRRYRETMSPAQRLATTMDLMEFGLAMQEQKLKRNHPNATDAELDQLFIDWLMERDPIPEGFRLIERER